MRRILFVDYFEYWKDYCLLVLLKSEFENLVLDIIYVSYELERVIMYFIFIVFFVVGMNWFDGFIFLGFKGFDGLKNVMFFLWEVLKYIYFFFFWEM